jgi:hypothetical protein
VWNSTVNSAAIGYTVEFALRFLDAGPDPVRVAAAGEILSGARRSRITLGAVRREAGRDGVSPGHTESPQVTPVLSTGGG